MPHTPERELYGDALDAPGSPAGDAAFARLVADFQGRLYAQILRSVGDHHRARDVLQEVFLRAYRALPRFDFGAGLRTWLGRIATNLCIDQARRTRPEISLEAPRGTRCQSLRELLRDTSPGPDTQLLQKEARGAVRRAVAGLPPLYAEIVQLRIYEGLSYADIAEITGARQGALKQRMLKANQLLRSKLERGEAGDGKRR